MNRRIFQSLSVVPLLLACGEELEPGSKVDSFRVLAEQVDLPYARPGEVVRLSSLSFDPAERPVTWAWLSCLNPNASDLQGCLDTIGSSDDVEQALVASGLGVDQVEVTIPSDALSRLPPEGRGSASMGVISVACPGELSFAEGPGGLPFLCQEPGGGRTLGLDEFSVGLKRISLRESDRNQNPQISGITFDGVSWPADEIKEVGACDRDDFDYTQCPAADKHGLGVDLPAGTIETGTNEQGHDFEEQVVIQYYATEGIFEYDTKIADQPYTGWVARQAASGQTLRLWFVVRDNRGGVTWTERQVRVR
jgi:hypothetical protein